ncbi:alpha/beta-hydrolase [Linderina pennispora]|uniref:Alpha/beta-hydrolase n=1 Tax=Linderina pennispora TaxID=61395 RepID=A0A1Y1VWP3_9FUNG|nr:alpha/beta-hydrolase [Linderina pennispora]ORX65700.1 alpha/beta-hydrolase [Linderina pennispora]
MGSLTEDSPIWSSLSKRGHINIADDKPLHLYYEIFGTGAKKVAFINGMGADRQVWENVVAEFLDLDDYQNFLETLGWEKGVNIVGVSMGGMVALEFASNYPQMVNTLTLAVTNAGLSVPPLRGIVDSVRANFISNPLERFEVICGTLYPESYLKAPAPEDTNCKTMMDLCIQRGIRRAKYTKPMSIWSFFGQVGTVLRHYNLGNLLPDKQILDHMVRTSNSSAVIVFRFEQIENAGHGVTSQCPDRFAKSIDTMVMEVAR